ncbi:MAG TPA: SRPBCC family protein [Candidatus Limnocylindrales bacterium]|nr:SRPBCC family protein [Candidatus Limnocylindrales bacterium]
MIRLQGEITIARPVEVVFELAADPARMSAWHPRFDVSERTSGDGPAVGSTFRLLSRSVGRRIETSGAITAFEPNRRVAWDGSSHGTLILVVTDFEPDGTGTRVMTAYEVATGGLQALGDPITACVLGREVHRGLASLKRRLETEC